MEVTLLEWSTVLTTEVEGEVGFDEGVEGLDRYRGIDT
jgi:hypothetical protein